ncbi:nucleophile aminohydrolase, partial [Pavlovales sp. CCMP2436]
GSVNGDGFGVGWYDEEPCTSDEEPCIFTSIQPAWNNLNLGRLARKVRSPLIFAHVRAAYPGMPVSEVNCHPFVYGRYMWMHNGSIASFAK